MINYDEYFEATFINYKPYCGFQNNQPYTIKISDNKPYGVMLDVLGEDDFETHCAYCNLESVERSWLIKENEEGEQYDISK